MTPVLEHYARQPIAGPVRAVEQGSPSPFGKPRGFWVSVPGEDDWPTWCRAEEFKLEALAVRHIVTLAEAANLLWIESAAALDSFQDRFGIKLPGAARFRLRISIDWRRVAEQHDGIVIAPYQGSRRHEVQWYYTWDCASGVIWHPRAIASVEAA